MTLQRGFPVAEFEARTRAAQAAMSGAGLGALLLTTEPEVRYFTGFLTRFWESPTRPWFVVLPAAGKPVAVIPAIGAALMGATWLDDIRTWASPDYADDGVSLLADALGECDGAIGVPSGGETQLRMPLADWHRLRDRVGAARFRDDAGITRRLRMVKSEAEIARVAATCAVADRAFARVPEVVRAGMPVAVAFRRFQSLCLDEGADAVPYIAGGAAPDGYADVISPAGDAPLAPGEVLMLDTGAIRDGYFCDFDRNFAIGPPAPGLRAAHDRLLRATRDGFDAARPGATAADIFRAMDRALGGGSGGRLGHGLGMQLTEPPSILPFDDTVLVPGMILTLEPCVVSAPGKILVHEENIVIRADGAEWLSTPATDLKVIA